MSLLLYGALFVGGLATRYVVRHVLLFVARRTLSPPRRLYVLAAETKRTMELLDLNPQTLTVEVNDKDQEPHPDPAYR